MKTKQKRWSEMTTEELAAATREFDDPNYNPPAQKPTKQELSQLRRVQARAKMNRAQITLALEKDLIEKVDDYAITHGTTFSDLVSDALKKWMGRKSA